MKLSLVVDCETPEELASALAKLTGTTFDAPNLESGAKHLAVKEEEEDLMGPTITEDMVRTLTSDRIQKGKKAEVGALIKGYGAKNVTGIPVDKYPEYHAALKALIND